MDRSPYDAIFYFIRIIGDVILIALLRTMYKDSMHQSIKIKKTALLVLFIYTILYIIGIFRNMHTLNASHDSASFYWLTFDIYETINAMWWWYVVYKCIVLSKIEKNIMLINAMIISIGNIISFKLNFYYLPYEGIKVFAFWFLNNGLGVFSIIAISYMIYYGLIKIQNRISL